MQPLQIASTDRFLQTWNNKNSEALGEIPPVAVSSRVPIKPTIVVTWAVQLSLTLSINEKRLDMTFVKWIIRAEMSFRVVDQEDWVNHQQKEGAEGGKSS